LSPTYAACCCVVEDEDCLDPCDCDLLEIDQQLTLYFNFNGREKTTNTENYEKLLCPGTPGGTENECTYIEETSSEETCNAYFRATLDISNINAKNCQSIPTVIEEHAGEVKSTSSYSLSESGGACRFGQDCYDEFQSCTIRTDAKQSFNLLYASPFCGARLEKYNDCSQDFPTSTRCACVESPIDVDQCFLRVFGGFTITNQQMQEYGGNRIVRTVASEGCNTVNTDEPEADCIIEYDSVVQNLRPYNFFLNSYSATMFEVLYAVERDADGKCIFAKFAERIGKQRVQATGYASDLCPLSVSSNVNLNDPNQTTKTYCGNTQQVEITGVNTLGDCGTLNYATFEQEKETYYLPCPPFNQNSSSIRITNRFKQIIRQNGTAGAG